MGIHPEVTGLVMLLHWFECLFSLTLLLGVSTGDADGAASGSVLVATGESLDGSGGNIGIAVGRGTDVSAGNVSVAAGDTSSVSGHGRGVIENMRSTAIDSPPPPPHVGMIAHPEGTLSVLVRVFMTLLHGGDVRINAGASYNTGASSTVGWCRFTR